MHKTNISEEGYDLTYFDERVMNVMQGNTLDVLLSVHTKDVQ